jgi:signal transduction histidine kinase
MSLRATILAAIAYVLVLVIVVLEVPLVVNLSRRVDAEVKAEAAGQAQLVATAAGDALGEGARRLQPLVDRAARELRGRVILLDGRGRVIVDSAGNGLRGTSYADRPEVAAALAGEPAQGERTSELLDEELLYTATPVLDRGRTAGAVRVTQSVAAVNEEVRRDALGLIAIGGLALLLGLGIAWVLAIFLARPPRMLAATARRVADGDLEARAPELGPREQREVARAFNEMTARLASALAAQRDFVANASHQLRTPLTGLRLRLEAAGDAARDPAVAEELEAAEEEVVRLSRLIENLLTLAREGQEPGEPRRVDLVACARRAAERWEAETMLREQRIALTGPASCHAWASADDLGIVLDNLLENASKYSPAGAAITIEWGAVADGSESYLAVRDRGPGLAPGEEGSALARFQRGSAASASSGTGLGLAIVSVLIERWGGTVALRNDAEGGLRAEVRLPAADDPERRLNHPLDEALPAPPTLSER